MTAVADCPFCLSPHLEITAEQADAVTWYGQVACLGCGLIIHSEECWRSQDEALADIEESWNKRAA